MLEYRNKIVDAFKSSTFLSEYLKKSGNAAYDYVLKVVCLWLCVKSCKKFYSTN